MNTVSLSQVVANQMLRCFIIIFHCHDKHPPALNRIIGIVNRCDAGAYRAQEMMVHLSLCVVLDQPQPTRFCVFTRILDSEKLALVKLHVYCDLAV